MQQKNTQWRNRIVGHADVAPDQLEAHYANFRTHPGFQQEALTGLIHELGYTMPVLVSQRTGRVLDGHLRVTLALREAQATIPVTYVDVDESEELLILSTADPLAAMANTDSEKLAQLLADVQSHDAAITHMLGQLALEHGITDGAAPQVTFPSYDESVEESVKYHECPSCHHRWPQ